MFVLIEVADREINAEKYDTFEEAQKAMIQYYNETGSCEDGQFFTFEAYKNYAGKNDTCYDWKIVEL